MDLRYSPEQQAFRKEVRKWFKRNKPKELLASFDTLEGFESHRLWEKKLSEGNWTAITWPKQFGGRDANLIEWLIFEEEYSSLLLIIGKTFMSI